MVGNKVDLPGGRAGLERLRLELADRPVIGTSTITNEGIPALLDAVASTLRQLPVEDDPSPGVRVYRLETTDDGSFQVGAVEEGVYRVTGKRVERLVSMTDLNSDEGTDYLQKQLGRLGVFEALEQAGVRGRRHGRGRRLGDRVGGLGFLVTAVQWRKWPNEQ